MGSMTPDKHPKSSQAGSPTTSYASDEPATLLDEEEESRGEVPGVSSQAEAVPSSPVEACNSPQGVKEAARPAVHKAAAKAITDVPPAIDCASQPVTPATTESAPPELTDTAAAEATAGVPPAVADACQDSKEQEAGHAAEGHAAGALQGKGGEARSSATISEAEPRASAEGKAAPNSSSALSEANVEPSIHAAEGFTDNRAAADSPEADVRPKAVPTTPVAKITAKATPNGPAAEFSAAETIAAKHAAGSAFTMPKRSAGSSSAQAKPERQVPKSKVGAQTASSAAAAATSPPIAPAQSDIKSAPGPTAAAGFANVAAAASEVSNPAAADAAPGSLVFSSKADGNVVALRHAGNRLDPVHAPGSAVSRTDHTDATATKSAAALLALDPAAAKPAVSKPTATEASSSAASGWHAAAAAPHPAQTGTEPKPVNGSSAGSSEGEYEVVAGAEYLEQLKDPQKRRLSGGATCVVNL